MDALSEQLTTQFYQWEMLGRGWLLANDAIELEAPFTPFFGHFPWKEPEYVDDGIKHTLISGLLASLKKPKPKKETPSFELSYEPIPIIDLEELTVLQVSLQKDGKVSALQSEQFLSMLSYLTKPVSFELIATSEKITIQLACIKSDALYVKAQVQTYFPSIHLREDGDALDVEERFSCYATVDFGLEQEFMRPINTNHKLDALTGLFSLLERVERDQKLIVQVLFNGLVNNWQNSILHSVTDYDGKCFFQDAPEMLKLAREKVSMPLLVASIRTIAFDTDLPEAYSLLNKVAFTLKQTYGNESNALIPLSEEQYAAQMRFDDIMCRTSRRLGMLLNTEELAAIVHFPSPELISKKLLHATRKTKLAPTIARGNRFSLGISENQGEEMHVTLSDEQRFKHTHIIGASGTGKSTLLSSMIIQDIEAGNGVAVLDPHGDLIETVLKYIPRKRISDVVVLDPSDSEYPVGFNILQAHSEIEKEILASDLVGIFKKLSTSWGDQMHSVLSNAILAFLESTQGGTLIDLRSFLLEPAFRTQFLQTVNDYNVHYYWQKQYPLLKGGSIGPILTRLDSFLRSRIIRNMVAQRRGLDFERILNEQKILLIKLSQGLIGEENSYLLGSFIVAKIHQAAFARQAKQERNNFFCYIDEFQHFTTDSMNTLLSGVRKYQLGLILAHQNVHQLQKADSNVASSVLSPIGARICFRVGSDDAKKLSEGFSYFEPPDFQNLSTGEAIATIEKPECDFSLQTLPLKPSLVEPTVQQMIIDFSRSNYAVRREEIEEQLFKSLKLNLTEEASTPKPKQRAETLEPVELPKDTKDEEAKVERPEPTQLSQQQIKETTDVVVKRQEQKQHRYLQNLIKNIGESKGYKATIEAPLPTRDGKVDVLLEHENITIACEVSVTTDAEWEVHNIQKCIQAGYTYIISCLADGKGMSLLQSKVNETFTESERKKIKILTPESLMAYLETFTVGEMTRETMHKGYRVKVTHTTISNEDQQRKKDTVARIIAGSLKRK